MSSLASRFIQQAATAGAIIYVCNVDGTYCFSNIGEQAAQELLDGVELSDPCTGHTVEVNGRPLSHWVKKGLVPSHLAMIIEAVR